MLLPFIFMAMWVGSVCGCVHFNGGYIEYGAFGVLTGSLASIVLGGIALLLYAKGLSVRRVTDGERPAMPATHKVDRWFVAAFFVSLTIYIIVWLIFISVGLYVATVPQFC